MKDIHVDSGKVVYKCSAARAALNVAESLCLLCVHSVPVDCSEAWLCNSSIGTGSNVLW